MLRIIVLLKLLATLSFADVTGIWPVRNGDTVYGAAKALGVDVQQIHSMNTGSMTDVWCVYTTETFFVPYHEPTAPASWVTLRDGTATLDLGPHSSTTLSTGCRPPGDGAQTISMTTSRSDISSSSKSTSTRSVSSHLLTDTANLHPAKSNGVSSTQATSKILQEPLNPAKAYPTCYPDGEKFETIHKGKDSDNSTTVMGVFSNAAMSVMKVYIGDQKLTHDKITVIQILETKNDTFHSFQVSIDGECGDKRQECIPDRSALEFKDIWRLCKHKGGYTKKGIHTYDYQLKHDPVVWQNLRSHLGWVTFKGDLSGIDWSKVMNETTFQEELLQ